MAQCESQHVYIVVLTPHMYTGVYMCGVLTGRMMEGMGSEKVNVGRGVGRRRGREGE